MSLKDFLGDFSRRSKDSGDASKKSCRDTPCPDEKRDIKVVVGPTGPTGPLGVGITGPAGPIGQSGPTGTGATGPTGDIGPTGIGVGVPGETGPTGPTGDVGETGPTGDQGLTGERGIFGPNCLLWQNGASADEGNYSVNTGNFTAAQNEFFINKTSRLGYSGAVGPSGNAEGWLLGISVGDRLHVTAVPTPSIFAIYTVTQISDIGSTVRIWGDLEAGNGQLPVGDVQTTICYVLSGETGSTGSQGDVGETGPTGEQGDVGDTGPTGDEGPIGETGPTGDQGEDGPTGDTGNQGEVGETGPTGDQGIQGDVGDTGPTGDQGIQGDIGETGPTGDQGIQGDVGETGPTGDTGVGETGPVGPTGPEGFDGLVGVKNSIEIDDDDLQLVGDEDAPGANHYYGTNGAGDKGWYEGGIGETGPTGDQGIQGDIGETGPTGDQGIQGDIGETGPTGEQGIQGDVGETGPTGDQGIQGDIGETGPTGEQGIQGDVGETGPTGDTGIQGDVGETGPTGEQGIQGDVGETGPTGEQGIQGDVGETGPTGDQGIQGDIGETGPTGDQGDAGETGPTGDQGDVGETGPIDPVGVCFDWQMVSTSGGTSSAGNMTVDTASFDSIGQIRVHGTAQGSVDATGALAAVAIGDNLAIRSSSSGDVLGHYKVTGISTGSGMYFYDVDVLSGTGTANVSTVYTVCFIQAGPTGPTGDTGPAGSSGSAGADGETGPTGPTGPSGVDGETGPVGPTGAEGSAAKPSMGGGVCDFWDLGTTTGSGVFMLLDGGGSDTTDAGSVSFIDIHPEGSSASNYSNDWVSYFDEIKAVLEDDGDVYVQLTANGSDLVAVYKINNWGSGEATGAILLFVDEVLVSRDASVGLQSHSICFDFGGSVGGGGDTGPTGPTGATGSGGGGIELDSEITSSSTLTAGHANKYIPVNSASDLNITIDGSVFDTNDPVVLEQTGNGIITVVAGSGMTLNGPLWSWGQYSTITIFFKSATVATVIGGSE